MSYGSNYPPTGGYGGGYAASGGPPPPPGMAAGYHSAYNVNYGGGGYTAPPGMMMQQPMQQPMQQAYVGAPAPMQPPQSMQYNQMANMMSNVGLQQQQWQNFKQMGLVEDDYDYEQELREKRRKKKTLRDSDDEDESEKEAERQLAEDRAKSAEAELAKLQAKLKDNEGLKVDLRNKFIDELMRRQEVNGTFELTHGTVVPFMKYYAEDSVAKWFQSQKGEDISGEKWDAGYDAEFLRNGIRGWGTDEQAIIDVVSTRSCLQRFAIRKEYKTAFGRDLIKDLKGDLSGDFEQCCLALFEMPARYDAWGCKRAIYGLGTDEACLIEILMTRTNAQIQEMVDEYNNITYEKRGNVDSSLEKDLNGDCSGDFKRLLISAAQGNRRLLEREQLDEAVEEVNGPDGEWTGMFQVNHQKLVNMKRCKRMADELYKAGEAKWGTDEETFNRVFSTQDYYSLRMVWDQYVKISQRDILNSVDRETSGDYKKGLCAIAQNIKCRPMYFAQRLYKSMKGLGTDDATLIRVVVSRAEIDMIQIKACFLECYHQTLWNFIKDDTSGDYKKLLLALVGRD